MARRVSIKSIIGEGTKFEGTISTNETMRIDGEFKGTITANSMLIVGEKGEINGDIVASDVVIAGTVNGNVKAKGKTEISATGRLLGDLTSKTLSIDEDAVFQGQCSLNVDSHEEDDDFSSFDEE